MSFVLARKVMEASRYKNSTDFIVNLGGRRPSRRVRAYNSTNDHELDNTLIEPYQDVYVGEFYG